MSPTGEVFEKGDNRFAFGVFTVSGEQVTDAQVAIYAAPSGGGSAIGPQPARIESLAVKPQSGAGIDFIHMEVYNHNNASAGLRPQMQAFRLQTEPWVFVIDRKGIIRTRIEGAFDASELEQAVRRVAG